MDRNRYESGSMLAAGVAKRIREARLIAQPAELSPSITDIPYRAVSIFLSLLLVRIGVSPNQITLLWTVLGLAGVAALGSTDYVVRMVGAVLLQLSYLLDFVDGEVARLRNTISKRGFFIDLVGHGLIKTGLFLSVGYSLFVSTHSFAYLYLAFFACISISSLNALPCFADHASVRSAPVPVKAKAQHAGGGTIRALLHFVVLLFESPGLFATILVGALIDRLEWVLVFYAVMGLLWFVYQAYKYRYE